MQKTVEELVYAARLHDAEAFTLLISRFEGIALSIAYAHARNAADAGDLVQEAFMRAWQRLDSLDDPSRFGHWLGRMVRNLAIDWRRRKRPVRFDPEIDVAGPTAAVSPLETSERKGQIDRALATLDEQSRACVTLRYYENLSSKEIGELLNLTPAAVDMRLSRARGQLRERLANVVQ
ncbi:MAG: sigma-70 family RNA polymerase sigma factor [Tepidisphaeraceae bacterium]